MIDTNLSWNSHIEYLYKKLIKYTSIFYKLRCNVHSHVIEMLYFAFVYPHMLYGIAVYANTCKTHLNKLCDA